MNDKEVRDSAWKDWKAKERALHQELMTAWKATTVGEAMSDDEDGDAVWLTEDGPLEWGVEKSRRGHLSGCEDLGFDRGPQFTLQSASWLQLGRTAARSDVDHWQRATLYQLEAYRAISQAHAEVLADFLEILGLCECCRRETEGVQLESSRTAYSDPQMNAPIRLCRPCAAEHHYEWDHRWEEYYAGLLP